MFGGRDERGLLFPNSPGHACPQVRVVAILLHDRLEYSFQEYAPAQLDAQVHAGLVDQGLKAGAHAAAEGCVRLPH
ncbi:hypothetical protein CBQ26_00350 [Deinococcus indicus]|uniref:Uncharacterized protein n=1 Tax=Deinococcus indicus TaxID=223556 RepID=A0A246BUX0_9DEIO|nr:hypothetical protein CBQ26_00350 [Deinococcus indicus]